MMMMRMIIEIEIATTTAIITTKENVHYYLFIPQFHNTSIIMCIMMLAVLTKTEPYSRVLKTH